ncbi:hypothetical protein AGOR_G00194740 [Albula goreensis]|uniref:Uncharacterized protein n=1 Tax=Albula goreensis TaxID=1534307 RepID=A0A8T3CRG6_9TELE|nr:hypothetical protein AGOR_G00194740 [Albula goreensis]
MCGCQLQPLGLTARWVHQSLPSQVGAPVSPQPGGCASLSPARWVRKSLPSQVGAPVSPQPGGCASLSPARWVSKSLPSQVGAPVSPQPGGCASLFPARQWGSWPLQQGSAVWYYLILRGFSAKNSRLDSGHVMADHSTGPFYTVQINLSLKRLYCFRAPPVSVVSFLQELDKCHTVCPFSMAGTAGRKA